MVVNKTWTCYHCGNINNTQFRCLKCKKIRKYYNEIEKPNDTKNRLVRWFVVPWHEMVEK